MTVRFAFQNQRSARIRLMPTADEVWNRAATAGGGPDAREGDLALASVFALHNLAMSGGLLDAVERMSLDQLEAAEAGFRWLRLEAAASVVGMVRQEIDAGVLDDDDRAERLEEHADGEYSLVVPTDQTLFDALQTRLAEDPSAFAPV